MYHWLEYKLSVYSKDGRERKRQTRMNSWARAKTQTNGGSTGPYVPQGVNRIGGEGDVYSNTCVSKENSHRE